MKKAILLTLFLAISFLAFAQSRDEFRLQAGLFAGFMRTDATYFDVSATTVVPIPSWYLFAGKRKGLTMGLFVHLNAGEMLYYYKNDGSSDSDWTGPYLFNGDGPSSGDPSSTWKQYGFSGARIMDFNFGWSTDLKILRIIGLVGPSVLFQEGKNGGTLPGKGTDPGSDFAYIDVFRKHVVYYANTSPMIGANAYLGIEARVLFLSLNAGIQYRNFFEGFSTGIDSILTHCEFVVGGGIVL